MKTRRHHNNEGRKQVKRGKTREQVKAMAKRLGVPYKQKAELRLEPLLVDELIAQLNYSMEMDDRHAAMALRDHWPKLREELEILRRREIA